MSVGKLTEFDSESDCWESYIDRLEQYFMCNSVKNELKVATLITAVGAETYELMTNLCTPHKPATKQYAELVEIVGKHLKPKPSVLAERYNFRRRVQNRSENIANFVTDLKKLSKNCGFVNDSLFENFKDQFVCGLRNDSIRQRIFTEEGVTFDKAYKIAVAMESAEADSSLVAGGREVPMTPVDVQQGRSPQENVSPQEGCYAP
ncbi:uncharacterized protein LOC121736312 [Aricia agestis]|uniref:uncharacterized protein LOC121736312 n=1 Tax=Aricia agestis TaxID=91739 RepID=UPI001C202C2F|nr:uncharacterized protein LOC121736312 [Aricia agestis]